MAAIEAFGGAVSQGVGLGLGDLDAEVHSLCETSAHPAATGQMVCERRTGDRDWAFWLER